MPITDCFAELLLHFSCLWPLRRLTSYTADDPGLGVRTPWLFSWVCTSLWWQCLRNELLFLSGYHGPENCWCFWLAVSQTEDPLCAPWYPGFWVGADLLVCLLPPKSPSKVPLMTLQLLDFCLSILTLCSSYMEVPTYLNFKSMNHMVSLG